MAVEPWVHLNHPCYEIDVVYDVEPEHEKPLRGQGYRPLSELRAFEAMVAAAQFALDFHAMPTLEFVQKYGAGATTRDVANKLREALVAAGYGEEK